MPDIPKSFEPKDHEQKWYDFWLEKGYFRPEANPEGKPYCIVIPPPNVTGSLHMGHALNATLQDILTRWKRMLGFRALWVPGTDHAGIATQNVVERELAKEDIDRHRLGREEFLRRVWHWKTTYGDRIVHQLQKLGSSCDWSRQRFTLDEGLSTSVKTVFVRLYEEGLIYRSSRLINWCPRCRTALSDLEVDHEELDGLLTYIRYPFADGSGYVVVATTRPETMLGDTAVAVNPGDERYGGLIGKMIALPLTGRIIPLIADHAVDTEFGTGAVKVTPAHDFNDEAMARRQSPPLESVSVIGDDGLMTEKAGSRYAGLDRYECRRLVVSDLNDKGLLEKQEGHRHAVGHCYRCKTVIEPYSTPQWYVKVGPLAEEAMRVVREKKIRIVPEGWENSYFAWMENIRDWCISRQIWWGHRIPVWYCDSCGETIVSAAEPERCSRCTGALRQDDDVLDTWFSSALWPFSTLGWPERTRDLKDFYPTDVLVTAFDILFFWVARMIMMGVKFMDDVPFRDVYIHALVRDEEGRKMSKSKGNVIDPLLLIDKYGADAFRFTLAAFAAQGRDIRFSEERVKGYKNFMNKLWNAFKFISINTEGHEIKKTEPEDMPSRWILSRLSAAAGQVNTALSEYRFNDAANTIYHFIWHEFCDWYIEMSKVGLQDESKAEEIRYTLVYTMDAALRLLHPFMPFLTEEIWQRLPASLRQKESVMISAYPESLPQYTGEEAKVSLLIEAVSGIRTIRGDLDIKPSAKVSVTLNMNDIHLADFFEEFRPHIERLAGVKELTVGAGLKKQAKSAVHVSNNMTIYVPIAGLVDIEAELERLRKELRKAEEELALVERKLSNEEFVKKAPEQVVKKENAKREELVSKRENLADSINRLKSLEV
jgi:valyl-tRNA synthetase